MRHDCTLRRILAKHATYYNEVRTHVSLEKDAPCTRAIERFGDIVAHQSWAGYTIVMHESDFSEATGPLVPIWNRSNGSALSLKTVKQIPTRPASIPRRIGSMFHHRSSAFAQTSPP
jgi:hypothetical protein